MPVTVEASAGAGPSGRRPRVLHVITHLDMGGAEGVAMQLIDSLRHEVDFAVFAVLDQGELSAVGRDMVERLTRWGVPHRFGVRGRFKSGGVLRAALRLGHQVRHWRADVVHLHTEVPELTFATATWLSPAARAVPLVRTVHNSTLWIDWPGIGRAVTGRLARADAVAVSRTAAAADAAIATRHPRPAADVVFNGIASPPPVPPRAPGGPFRLLFAGRLVHQKGADLLPAILTAAHRRVPGAAVSVTIAGKGVLRDEVARGLDGALPGWSVAMVPPIGGLAARLGEFDAVLLPSRFEGLALLPFEVLMAGLPLITTDAPGLDEAIPADYPLKAAIEDVDALGALVAEVIAGGDAHRPMAAGYGAALARRFSPEAMAAAYLARYRRLAGGGEA